MSDKIKERLIPNGEGAIHEMTDSQGNSAGVMLTAAQMIEIIKELRKPDDETVAAKEEAERKRQISMKQMIELAKIESENTRRNQERCSHKKENGNTLWMGQIHSDGMFHPLCFRCQKMGTPMEPPRELLAQGLG